MSRPRTIHDFYGFPDELFAVEYPAPGSPDVAERVAEVVKPRWVGLDVDSWGLDHGTWSVLVHMFPGADVPVVQLSINALQPLDYHLDIGRRLAPLRDEGVLVVAQRQRCAQPPAHRLDEPAGGFDWAQRFGDAARDVLSSRPATCSRLVDHQDFELAVPTPDHFIPLLYIAGLAEAAEPRPTCSSTATPTDRCRWPATRSVPTAPTATPRTPPRRSRHLKRCRRTSPTSEHWPHDRNTRLRPVGDGAGRPGPSVQTHPPKQPTPRDEPYPAAS